nr:MAG TPA: hypothetical protein [Bacteriophage sp.]
MSTIKINILYLIQVQQYSKAEILNLSILKN